MRRSLLSTVLLALTATDALRVPALPASRRAVATRMSEADSPAVAAAPDAFIEFIEGVPEPCVPDVSLTRSRDGSTGVATFTFDNPSFLSAASEALARRRACISRTRRAR